MNGSRDESGEGSPGVSDRSHEPAEPELPGEDNPGERLIAKYDPTIDADGDSDGDVTDADVPATLSRTFWFLVAVFNVAVLALALGVMLIAFQGRWGLGGQVTLAGAVLSVYGYYRYRKYRRGADRD